MTDWTAIAAEQRLPLSSVLAEALQVVVLDALFAQPESETIAFQGGSAIRLVYGGYRYSEDIDLAGQALDEELAAALVQRARSPVERVAAQLLGPGTAEWKPPRRDGGRMRTYWFHFTPRGQRSTQRVKIELTRSPVYRAVPAPVKSDLDVLGTRPLVRALEPAELLAEKVVALLGRPYLKGLDVFDLWFLQEALDVTLDAELLTRKAADYRLDTGAATLARRLDALSSLDLEAEMACFLPGRYRRQLRAGGYHVLRDAAARVGRAAADVLGTA